MTIGRNDLCNCGSGKKYKKCCMDKTAPTRVSSDDEAISLRLPEIFFKLHPLKQTSAAGLMYGLLKKPGAAELAEKIVKLFVFRARKQARQINKETDCDRLIQMMKRQTDNLNYSLLIQKMLQNSDYITPRILENLKDNEDAVFAELAVRYLYNIDDEQIWGTVVEITNQSNDPYTCSILSLLLGMRGPREVFPVLWKNYAYLKEMFPEEDYDQGPLYGLYDLSHRFEL